MQSSSVIPTREGHPYVQIFESREANAHVQLLGVGEAGDGHHSFSTKSLTDQVNHWVNEQGVRIAGVSAPHVSLVEENGILTKVSTLAVMYYAPSMTPGVSLETFSPATAPAPVPVRQSGPVAARPPRSRPPVEKVTVQSSAEYKRNVQGFKVQTNAEQPPDKVTKVIVGSGGEEVPAPAPVQSRASQLASRFQQRRRS